MNGMALSALIDDACRVNGWSNSELARLGDRSDERLTKQDISNWRLHGMPTIVPDKVRALARGLGIPAHRVALIALADHGIIVPQDVRSPEQAIEQDHTLTAETRRNLLAMLQSARRG